MGLTWEGCSSQQTRIASECGPIRSRGCGINQVIKPSQVKSPLFYMTNSHNSVDMQDLVICGLWTVLIRSLCLLFCVIGVYCGCHLEMWSSWYSSIGLELSEDLVLTVIRKERSVEIFKRSQCLPQKAMSSLIIIFLCSVIYVCCHWAVSL